MKKTWHDIVNDPWFKLFECAFKLFVVVFVLTLLVAGLTGCDADQVQSEVVEDTRSMFVEVEQGDIWTVVYHRDTRVMYVVSDSSYNYGNFTLLVNPDGTPMLWEGY